jgi:hypothetical protein
MLREKNNLVHNKTPDLGRAKTATPVRRLRFPKIVIPTILDAL